MENRLKWNYRTGNVTFSWIHFFLLHLNHFNPNRMLDGGGSFKVLQKWMHNPIACISFFSHDSIMSSWSNCNNSTISTNRATNNNSAFYEKCHNRFSDKSWNVIDDLNPWQPWFALNDSIKSSTLISLSSGQIRSYETINYVS